MEEKVGPIEDVKGVIARRVLITYRIDPVVVSEILPAPMRPKLYERYAIGGVSLIRHHDLQTDFAPFFRLDVTEGAEYHFAVEFDEDGKTRSGVYVVRRESNSFSDRDIFELYYPGGPSHSHFDSVETESSILMKVTSLDDDVEIEFKGNVRTDWPEGSVFLTIEDAGDFFFSGQDAVLGSEDDIWTLEAMHPDVVNSTYFDCTRRFLPGSIELDNVILMRGSKPISINRSDPEEDRELMPFA